MQSTTRSFIIQLQASFQITFHPLEQEASLSNYPATCDLCIIETLWTTEPLHY